MNLAIDADLLVFKAAAYWQDKFSWEPDGDEVIIPHIEEAWHLIVDRINQYSREFPEYDHVYYVSHKDNFRKQLWDKYKANRDPSKKPQALGALINRLKENQQVECWSNLEADDMVGIACTKDPETIAVTEDKDQATVPGKWYNPRKPELGIREITLEEANYNHLIQTMSGDSSDGYKGIPRVGPKTAEKILKKAKEDFLSPWLAVVDAYKSKGLTEQEALRNARMAYILRDGDYNMDTGEVYYWEPKMPKFTGG